MGIFKRRRAKAKEKETAGLYIFHIPAEGFYVKHGVPSKLFKKLKLAVIDPSEMESRMGERFFINQAFMNKDDILPFLEKHMRRFDIDLPDFKRRKPFVVKSFTGKWELRMLIEKHDNGKIDKKFYPAGKPPRYADTIEYITFQSPKALRRHTGNYIPVFFLK